MNAESEPERLSRISTRWTLIFAAHGDELDERQRSRNELLLKYSPAIYRYVLAILKNNGFNQCEIDDAATEFCSEFALKFLEGAFHRADPERGSFRVYLKSAIKYEIWRFIQETRQAIGPLPPQVEFVQQAGDELSNEWRRQLVELATEKMRQSHPRYVQVLELRMENPQWTAAELGAEYESVYAEPLSRDNVRKILEKARRKMARLIIAELSDSLEVPSPEAIASELRAVGLFGYCRGELAS